MTQKTVLIVEDDQTVVEHIEFSLERWGYLALWANSKEQALQAAVEKSPDLVLMDIRLTGDLDGVEAARHIQACVDIPIVYLSAHTEHDLLQQAKITEPYAYLVKPVQDSELYATIEIALYKHTQDRRNRAALEQLVAERTAELNATNEKLKRAYAALKINTHSFADEEFTSEKILIIDDEPDLLHALAMIMQNEGYVALTAANGLEGLARFRADAPDLVITDVRMPGKDGMAVLTDLKATGTDVDVIVLTGHSDEALAITCLRAGAYDYLLKPLEDIEMIIASVKKALHKRHLEIQNRQLFKELEALAITDPLTQCFNRRHLESTLDEEILRSQRYGHSFCGIMLDIDFFKTMNDTHGHLFGDYVMTELADIMRQTFRATDRIFRYGGDEFFILMPETRQIEAELVANRLRETVNEHAFRFETQQAQITLSLGGALYPDQAANHTDVLKHADAALYQAKEQGRNRVIFKTWT